MKKYFVYFRAFSPSGECLGTGRYGPYRTVSGAAYAASRKLSMRDEIRIAEFNPFSFDGKGLVAINPDKEEDAAFDFSRQLALS